MTTQLLVKDLQPSTGYYVQVRSVNATQQSDWSYRKYVLTGHDTTIPKQPDNITWTSTGRSFVATWSAVTETIEDQPLYNFDKYQIRITYQATGQSVVYDTKATRFDFTYEMNQAVFGTAKSPLAFEIRSITATPVASDYTFPLVGTNPVPKPVVLDNPIPLVESISLSWTASDDLDIVGYNVYASHIDAFTPNGSNLIGNTAATSKVFNTTSGTPWFFHVRAVDIFGQEGPSTQSIGVTPKSEVLIDTTSPKAPSTVSISATLDLDRFVGVLHVSWPAVTKNVDETDCSDLRNYVVRYSRDGTNWNFVTVDGDTTSVNIDVMAGINYYVAVESIDFIGNKAGGWKNASTYPIASPDFGEPPKPQTMPGTAVVGNTLSVQVTPTGFDDSSEHMPSYVVGYDVFASRNLAFNTFDITTYIGHINVDTVTSGLFNLPSPTQTDGVIDQWAVRIKAVGRNGLTSPASDLTLVTPGLISSSNIGYAQITDAHVNDLSVSKLVAGHGIITSLTIGNTSTAGDIHSEDYEPGVSGWMIGTGPTGGGRLDIQSGTIAAKVLQLRDSPNRIQSIYADFEAHPITYSDMAKENTTITIDETKFRVNSQSLKCVTTNVSNAIYLGTSLTDYNVPVESGKTYIFSYYVNVSTAVGTASSVYFNDGTSANIEITANPTTNTWIRHYGMFTAPSTASTALFSIRASGSGVTYNIDCVQVEEKVGSLLTPNSWAPPSMTTISGGQIMTGSIQSDDNIVVNGVTVPRWFINLRGAAQFSDAQVLGQLVVGGNNLAGAGSDFTDSSVIRSWNFATGLTGWQIGASGTAEFQNAILRGNINATSGQISGLLEMTGFGKINAGRTNTSGILSGQGIEVDRFGIRSYGSVNQVIDAWSTTGYPLAIARGTDSNTYVLDSVNNFVRVYYSNKNLPYTYFHVGPTAFGDGDYLMDMAIDTSNGVYVSYWDADDFTTTIYLKSNFGSTIGSFSTGSGTLLTSIWVEGSSTIFGYDENSNVIKKFDTAGGSLGTINIPSGTFVDMVGDNAGHIYVFTVNGGTGTVTKMTSSGTVQSSFTASTPYVNKIAVDLFGNIYLATQFGFISKHNAAGTLLTTINASTNNTNISSLVVDASSNIYVCDVSAYLVYKISPFSEQMLNIDATTGQIDAVQMNVSAPLRSDVLIAQTIYSDTALNLVGSGQWLGQAFPAISRHQTTTQNVPSSQNVKIVVHGGSGVDVEDVYKVVHYSAGDFTINTAGLYLIIANCHLLNASQSSGGRSASLQLNGQVIASDGGYASTSSDYKVNLSAIRRINPGSVINFVVAQSSGSSVTTSGSTDTGVQIIRLGA